MPDTTDRNAQLLVLIKGAAAGFTIATVIVLALTLTAHLARGYEADQIALQQLRELAIRNEEASTTIYRSLSPAHRVLRSNKGNLLQ